MTIGDTTIRDWLTCPECGSDNVDRGPSSKTDTKLHCDDCGFEDWVSV